MTGELVSFCLGAAAGAACFHFWGGHIKPWLTGELHVIVRGGEDAAEKLAEALVDKIRSRS